MPSYTDSSIRAAMSRSLKVGRLDRVSSNDNLLILGEINADAYYVLRYVGKRNSKEFFIEIEILGTEISTLKSYLDNTTSSEYEEVTIESNQDLKAEEKYYSKNSQDEYLYLGSNPEYTIGNKYYIHKGFNIYMIPYEDISMGRTVKKLVLLMESSNPANITNLNNGSLEIEYALGEFKFVTSERFDELGLSLPETYIKGYFNIAHYKSSVSLDGSASIEAERISTPTLISGSLSFTTENINVTEGMSVGTLSIAHLHTRNFQTENIAAESITTPVIKIGNWEIRSTDHNTEVGFIYRK